MKISFCEKFFSFLSPSSREYSLLAILIKLVSTLFCPRQSGKDRYKDCCHLTVQHSGHLSNIFWSKNNRSSLHIISVPHRWQVKMSTEHTITNYLFLKDRIVPPSILGVEVPAPVGYHHCQGGGQEHNDEEAGLGVATIEETQHGQEQQQSKEDVQVPEYELIVFRFRFWSGL